MNFSIRAGLAVALATSSVVPAMAAPATSVSVSVSVSNEAAGLALLDQAVAAYAKLDGLSMHWAIYIDFSDGTGARGFGTLDFDKTGRARVTATRLLRTPLVVNEAQKDPKSALEQVMERMPLGVGDMFSDFVVGNNPWRGPDFGPTGVANNIRLLSDNGVASTIEGLDTSEGKEMPFSDDNSYYFDPNDHLLRRIESKSTVAGKTLRTIVAFSEVRVNPQFAPDTFVSATPFKPLATEELKEPEVYWDPKIKVGAAPYALKGVDLEKYKGKVVLIDFWATWCGPCVAEVPSVLKSYGKHHPKGFEVVGISLDRKKQPLNDFVKARKLPWKQIFDADTPKPSNATRYGVQAIPFTLLIGKDGKIAAVNPRGEELEPALKKALAG